MGIETSHVFGILVTIWSFPEVLEDATESVCGVDRSNPGFRAELLSSPDLEPWEDFPYILASGKMAPT